MNKNRKNKMKTIEVNFKPNFAAAKWIAENGIKSEFYPNDHGRHVMDGVIIFQGGLLVGYRQGDKFYVYQTKSVGEEIRYYGDPAVLDKVDYDATYSDSGWSISPNACDLEKDTLSELNAGLEKIMEISKVIRPDLEEAKLPHLLHCKKDGEDHYVLAIDFGE